MIKSGIQSESMIQPVHGNGGLPSSPGGSNERKSLPCGDMLTAPVKPGVSHTMPKSAKIKTVTQKASAGSGGSGSPFYK